MIYDCFTFFNELDLLEFRLKLLDGIVDKFVIAEANLTHSGMPKPYIFESNKLRYEKWKEKIIYIKVELSTAGLIFNENEAKYNPQNGSWVLENRQREALTSVITVANDNDMIMVGDLDEIPDPMILEKLDYRFPIVLS
jgi:beta-1,4-mannosyl-glycoprotein beta-1,4-N-acetylglucosaminyltransferase